MEFHDQNDLEASIPLSDGMLMPCIGLGTSAASAGLVGKSVKQALELGYRHLDCAHAYGNEAEIGEALHEVFQLGKITREDVFVVSKLSSKDMAKEHVLDACRLTLKNLRLDYLDVYLVHGPTELKHDMPGGLPKPGGYQHHMGYDPDRYFETWRCMEQLLDMGLARSIGVSNLTVKKLEDLLSRNPAVLPVCNQVELHPYLPQEKLCNFCRRKGITMVAYTPLGNPGRSKRIPGQLEVLDDPVVAKIAVKHGCSPAQVLIAWHVNHQRAVLVKSVSESRLKENLAAGCIKLEVDDMKELDGLEPRHRYVQLGWAPKEGETLEEFWDGEFQ